MAAPVERAANLPDGFWALTSSCRKGRQHEVKERQNEQDNTKTMPQLQFTENQGNTKILCLSTINRKRIKQHLTNRKTERNESG